MRTSAIRNGFSTELETKSLRATRCFSMPSEATFKSVSSLVTSHCFPRIILNVLWARSI